MKFYLPGKKEKHFEFVDSFLYFDESSSVIRSGKQGILSAKNRITIKYDKENK